MPQYCVLIFRRRGMTTGNNHVTERALVVLTALCILLCLSLISGVYQIHVTNVVLQYYQTAMSEYDDDFDDDSTATISAFDFNQSVTIQKEPLPVQVLPMVDVDEQLFPVRLSDDTASTGTNGTSTTHIDATSVPSFQQHRMKNIDTTSYYNLTRPTNLRLVIMGDSISRYQYISLVYFLQTGTWITDATNLIQNADEVQASSPTVLSSNTPLHCKTPGIKARERFYSLSHTFLQPNELLCDCRGYSENRYFIDSERNNSITYITKFGKNSTSGRYVANQIRTAMSVGDSKQGQRNKRSSDQWKYKYWNETIHYHIAQLKPKPQFLLFNAGLHPHDLDSKYIRQGIADVTKRHNIIPIYKTTTYPNNVSIGWNDFPLARHDALLCGNRSNESDTNFKYCIDMSWTSQLFGDDHYYDYYHFKPYWNHYMNVQTLLYIQQLQLHQDAQYSNIKQPLRAGKSDNDKNNLPSIFGSEDIAHFISRRTDQNI